MPFEDFCEFWSRTLAFSNAGGPRDRSNGFAIFQPLIALFDAWTVHLPSLSGATAVLHIAAAVESVMSLSRDKDGDVRSDKSMAQLDELETRISATESAAQRFRHAHEVIAEAVAQTLESGGDVLQPELIQARNTAFDELRVSLQRLEESSSNLNLATIRAANKNILAPIEAAFARLERATCVQLTGIFEDVDGAPTGDEGSDATAVEACGAVLRDAAWNVLQRVEHSNRIAQQFAEQCLASNCVKMLEASSRLRASICSIVTLEGESEDASLSAIIRGSTPWPAILASTARHLAPLRAVEGRAGSLQARATALRSEAEAFAAGFAAREQNVSALKTAHMTMKKAQKAFGRLRLELEDSGDDDSGAESVDPEELSRQREALSRKREELSRQREVCRVATALRDTAARQLFLAAKAYHPETLVEQQKRLSLTGLSAVWSKRTLEEYDDRNSFFPRVAARHAMYRAKYNSNDCVLKVVQLQVGSALCKEAEILRRLDHPNIVKLEAAFVDTCSLYLHFPYAVHGDLEHYLGEQIDPSCDARISANQLRRMARQLCEALAYLAERSIVHCDVKPANVFVDEESSGVPIAILGDFDVSHTATGRTATLTMTLHTRGVATHYSAGYAAPEVLLAPRGQPPRATSKLDVFGLGCVIYHMHMYPRALPEPEILDDDVTSRPGLFEKKASGALPNCAVAVWSAAVPRDCIASATRANPTARLSARELLQTGYMRDADGDYARMAVQRPAYWKYQEHTGNWPVRESPEVVAEVERLLNATAKPEEHGRARNSRGIRFARFRVMSVRRNENSQVWSAYASRRRGLADALAGEGYVLPQQAQRLSTSHFTYPLESGSLEGAAGEVFLFHGTSKPESIASSGFDVRYAFTGAGAGTLFGSGLYFAESASKSDQYVRPSAGGKLTMVLARVCLGRCQIVNHTRRNAHFLPVVEGRSTPAVPIHYDSILAAVPGMPFREVVVGRDTATYPELLVEYERV